MADLIFVWELEHYMPCAAACQLMYQLARHLARNGAVIFLGFGLDRHHGEQDTTSYLKRQLNGTVRAVRSWRFYRNMLARYSLMVRWPLHTQLPRPKYEDGSFEEAFVPQYWYCIGLQTWAEVKKITNLLTAQTKISNKDLLLYPGDLERLQKHGRTTGPPSPIQVIPKDSPSQGLDVQQELLQQGRLHDMIKHVVQSASTVTRKNQVRAATRGMVRAGAEVETITAMMERIGLADPNQVKPPGRIRVTRRKSLKKYQQKDQD